MNESGGQIYDRDFFIRFFEAIPDDRWTEGHFESPNGRRCAMGHLFAAAHKISGNVTDFLTIARETGKEDMGNKPMLIASRVLAHSMGLRGLETVNDNHSFPGFGPRGRILTFLRSLPDPQNPIVSVTVTDTVPEPVLETTEDTVFISSYTNESDFCTYTKSYNPVTGMYRMVRKPASQIGSYCLTKPSLTPAY